ncbi:MAG: asparagine synthase C-terminal domain-containing protein, partial [Bacteroidales bacterium]|nr:asparagine synthase C-terminal domain-containing protein [Bacteroidales bacterium]
MIQELEDIIVRNIWRIPENPLSLLLSGGIDSSLVLALIRKTYPDVPIHTFTLAQSIKYPDIIFAREMAGLFETKHHEIIPSDKEYRNFEKEFRKIDIYKMKGDINLFILCSVAREYSNIIVTGDGGDECFGGYWLHKYPLGHKETGTIKSFEEIHPEPAKHIKEMVKLGFRDSLFKEKSTPEDYEDVWNYFIERLAPKHLDPLLNTTKSLNMNPFTPLWSESILDYMRGMPYFEKIGRKIEKELAGKYLPDSIIERESIGF